MDENRVNDILDDNDVNNLYDSIERDVKASLEQLPTEEINQQSVLKKIKEIQQEQEEKQKMSETENAKFSVLSKQVNTISERLNGIEEQLKTLDDQIKELRTLAKKHKESNEKVIEKILTQIENLTELIGKIIQKKEANATASKTEKSSGPDSPIPLKKGRVKGKVKEKWGLFKNLFTPTPIKKQKDEEKIQDK